jgi:replicative DNA helicase
MAEGPRADVADGSTARRGRRERAETAVPGRVPPHDLDAERSVLSSLLLDPRAFHDVSLELRADDFYHPAHQTVYRAMLAIHEEGRPVDLITLSEQLNARKQLDQVGGTVFLAEVADFAATAANVAHHARIVRDKSVKRRLAAVATEIVESSFEDAGSADELLDFAESKIFDVSKAQSRSTFQSLHAEMPGTFDYVEAIMNRGGELTGIPTGFRDLDQMTGGLQAGELVVIAARPSMGKTAFALNIARNAAVDHGKKVAVFSLEMTTRSLIIRLLSSEAAIDFSSLRKGFLPMTDYRRLQTAADKLTNAEIWIDDSGALDILEIKAKSRRLHAEHGLDLVVLDYLQLAHAEGRRDRKDLEVAEISKGLKALAKELEIPVISLSQLNRGPEQRDPDKRRPMMGDLRESGAIEQDADVIAFIYRDVVYNKDTEDPRLAEIIIEKQRNGPTGTVKLDFEGRFARFSNRAARDEDAGGPSGGGGGGFVGPAGGDDGWSEGEAF